MSINAACGSENHTTSRPSWKYTPSVAYGDVSPGGGDLLSAVFFYLSCITHSVGKSSPSGGKVVPQAPKGVHFPRAAGAVLRFCRRQAALKTYCREAAIHNPRPEGPSNLRTLRPIGPVHLKNLHARRAIHNPRAKGPSTLTPQVCPTNPQNQKSSPEGAFLISISSYSFTALAGWKWERMMPRIRPARQKDTQERP